MTAYNYPKPAKTTHGARVCWRFYRAPADALEASMIAKREGRDLEAKGHDFGMEVIGSVKNVGKMIAICCP